VPLSRESREKGAVLLEKVKDDIPGCSSVSVLDDDDFTLAADF